ncbi:hypothetical protein [Ruminococcus flavefaciens]|uniref:hypothetical protein n=1 Tax=Ruminococcus flavefaciens TaxID=1265 RepID=UPI0026EAFBF0|nr:hypothetical protein [Ruminococcus flavefaciens]
MSNFNNADYENLLTDCLNDAFYATTSFRGKIAHIRQVAEIVVRKLIDCPSTQKLMLGQTFVKDEIKKLNNCDHIQSCVEDIIKDDGLMHRGNSCTHTGVTDSIEDKEYREAINSLQELIACLFIDYFTTYKFGSKSEIMKNFSLLPPVIRFKTLTFLYSKDNSNVNIIDKLVLSMIKTFGADKAKEWVENNKEHLEKIHSTSPEMGALFAMLGHPQLMSRTMYDCCVTKINDSASFPQMYKTFEEAKRFYSDNNTLNGTDEEALKFKDLMDFVFIGRKEEPLPVDNNPFFVLHCFAQK